MNDYADSSTDILSATQRPWRGAALRKRLFFRGTVSPRARQDGNGYLMRSWGAFERRRTHTPTEPLPAPARIAPQDRLAVVQKFIKMLHDDAHGNGQLQRLVVVYGDIAKPDHALQAVS